MRTDLSLVAAGVLGLFIGGCAAPAPPAPAAPATEYKPTATIKEVMDSMVDPSADVIWESVATYVSAKGIEEKFPKNDEEWAAVRRSAITLLESSNVLAIPGRHVAKPGQKAEAPEVELGPEEIEKLIVADPAAWTRLAHGLQEAVLPVIAAIDMKSAEGVLYSADKIDLACENCHLKYWYPNQGAPGAAPAVAPEIVPAAK